MEEKDLNKVYDKVKENRKKYLKLMESENSIENAVKFNAKLNKRMEKLGVKTCKYVPRESDDGRKD